MKYFLCILAASALLCGCKPKAALPDPRMAKLEKELVAIKSKMDIQWEHATNVAEVVRMQQKILERQNGEIDHLQNYAIKQIEQFDLLATGVSNAVNSLQQPTARTSQNYVRPPATPVMKEGVPIAIYNQIVAEAVKVWPNSYSLQIDDINREIAAYKKLHP